MICHQDSWQVSGRFQDIAFLAFHRATTLGSCRWRILLLATGQNPQYFSALVSSGLASEAVVIIYVAVAQIGTARYSFCNQTKQEPDQLQQPKLHLFVAFSVCDRRCPNAGWPADFDVLRRASAAFNTL